MKGQDCLAANCGEVPQGENLFCETHWRKLAKWARNELVRLRNSTRRGSKAAMTQYAKAAVVAAKLVSDG